MSLLDIWALQKQQGMMGGLNSAQAQAQQQPKAKTLTESITTQLEEAKATVARLERIKSLLDANPVIEEFITLVGY